MTITSVEGTVLQTTHSGANPWKVLTCQLIAHVTEIQQPVNGSSSSSNNLTLTRIYGEINLTGDGSEVQLQDFIRTFIIHSPIRHA